MRQIHKVRVQIMSPGLRCVLVRLSPTLTAFLVTGGTSCCPWAIFPFPGGFEAHGQSSDQTTSKPGAASRPNPALSLTFIVALTGYSNPRIVHLA